MKLHRPSHAVNFIAEKILNLEPGSPYSKTFLHKCNKSRRGSCLWSHWLVDLYDFLLPSTACPIVSTNMIMHGSYQIWLQTLLENCKELLYLFAVVSSEHLDFSSVVMMINGIPIGALAEEQHRRNPGREPGTGKI